MARQSKIPPPQRVELVSAVLRGTEKLEVLARRHQVSTNTLRHWWDEFIAAGRERLTGHGDVTAAATENKRLQREPTVANRNGPGGSAGWRRTRRTRLNPQTQPLPEFQLETRGETS